jgi:hypothetical protein
MTTVKQIESKSQLSETKRWQDHLNSHDECFLAKTYRIGQTPEDIKRLLELRERCYEMFMNLWAHYIEDMNKFVRASHVIKIWPGTIMSFTGCKLLLRGDTGPVLLKSISSILENNSSTTSDLMDSNQSVLINSTVILYLLSKKHPGNNLMKGLFEDTAN